MNRINTEWRIRNPENPEIFSKGQRKAETVFEELRRGLENDGKLPDEYFLLGREWENGREWPEGGEIVCAVDYGGSEGIYLDIALKYLDAGDQWKTEHFATGKTLGESDADMDRMFLIASAVTSAFHPDGVHARYVQLEQGENGEDDVEHDNEI